MIKTLLLILITLTLSAEVKVGDTVNNFKLPYLYDTSKVVSLKTNAGKVTLVNLWASWCSGCKEEMPHFVSLQKKYKKSEFRIILASVDKKKSKSIKFLNKVDKDKTLLALYDKEKILPKEYRAMGMPSSYLLDENLKIIQIFTGSLDEDAMGELESTINKTLGK